MPSALEKQVSNDMKRVAVLVLYNNVTKQNANTKKCSEKNLYTRVVVACRSIKKREVVCRGKSFGSHWKG